MTRWRKLSLALLTVAGSTALCLLALLAIDTWVHRKFDDIAGLNRHGYRGPVAGPKQPNEFRIVALGGSTVLGYGVRWTDAFPALLEQSLSRTVRRPVKVINLGANGEGAYGMRATLDDFAFLEPDLAVLYVGYNDLPTGFINTIVSRRNSVVFRMTGYFPILPLVLHEKIMAIRYGGDLEAAYAKKATVFRPNLPQRAYMGALGAAESLTASLARQLGTLSPDPATVERTPTSDERGALEGYLNNVIATIRAGRARGMSVVMVSQPYISDRHIRQQAALANRLVAEFGKDSGVRYVNLGKTIDLSNKTLAWDGMHLTREGNATIANALAPVVQTIVATDPGGP